MLEHTFIHIPGIGEKTEQRLWQAGILTWKDYLKTGQGFFSARRDAFVRRQVADSVEHRADIFFFHDRLTSGHHWRLFEAFEDKSVYLDIETNGGYQGVEEITVIGLYDGHHVQTYVNGMNLNDFEAGISRYDLVITFNGSLFDLPVIRRQFPWISLPQAHIDLRFFLRKLGYRGGLKAIEKAFFLSRHSEIEGLTGYDAVNLWRAYQWGETSALERLIQYNTADIVHLKPLMEAGFEKMKKELLGGEGGFDKTSDC